MSGRILTTGLIILVITSITLTPWLSTTVHASDAGYAWCTGLVKFPRWALPEPVKPGSTLLVELSKPIKVDEIVLANGVEEYKLKVETKGTKLTAKLPPTVKPGLYDLILYSSSKIICGEHNAVWVLKEYPKKLVLLHISDNHFGVVNPTGRTAESYNLALAILALSIPNITVIVDTGDLADTASVDQYKNARMILGLVDKPLLIIPGNHDHVTGDENYKAYVGPLTWNLTLGSFMFLGLDTGYEGYIDISQAEWAAKVLAESKAKAKIVLFHHPHFAYVYGKTPHSFTVKSWEELVKILKTKKPGSRYPYVYTSWLTSEKAFTRLVKAFYEEGVTLVLSGHIHLDSYAEVIRADGTKIYYVVTTTLGGPVRTGDYHGFKILVVDDKGHVEVKGADVPWSRHASFNIEGLDVAYTRTETAVTAVVALKSKELASLMPRLVLAIPLPCSWKDKVKLEAPGAEKTWIKATPVYCAAYAVFPKPEPGKVYRLIAYTAPDKEPPKIEAKTTTIRVPAGYPVTVKVKITDDSWGVANVTGVLAYDTKTIKLTPAKMGSRYMFSIPPLPATVKQAKLVVYAEDASGKKTTQTITITYYKPEKPKPTTTTRTTTTPKTITTPQTTTITTKTPKKETITKTLPPITFKTLKRVTATGIRVAGPAPAAIAVPLIIGVVAIALVIVLARRR